MTIIFLDKQILVNGKKINEQIPENGKKINDKQIPEMARKSTVI